jgi:hypothetical protein
MIRRGSTAATGGSITVNDSDDSVRLTDDGDDTTYATYNFGGTFVMDLSGHPRTGDNGGNVFMTFDGDVIADVAEYLRIGDDSNSGAMVFADNASVTTGVIRIKGNVAAVVAGMVCDGSGRLTGYGTAAGVVISLEDGYTVVTAVDGVDPNKAYCASPPNGAERVTASDVELCWAEGECIGSRGKNIVYFGPADECEAVCSDTQGGSYNIEINNQGETCVNVGALELWGCYCWRVDTFCESGSTVKGDVWTFCTGCEDIPGDVNRDCLVNFLDYACVAGDFGEEQLWPE